MLGVRFGQTPRIHQFDPIPDTGQDILQRTPLPSVIKNFRAEAEALKQEKLSLQRRQKAAEKTVERLVGHLEQFLEPGTIFSRVQILLCQNVAN